MLMMINSLLYDALVDRKTDNEQQSWNLAYPKSKKSKKSRSVAANPKVSKSDPPVLCAGTNPNETESVDGREGGGNLLFEVLQNQLLKTRQYHSIGTNHISVFVRF